MINIEIVEFKEPLSILVPLHNKQSNIKNTIKLIVENIRAPNLQILIIENESIDLSKQYALEIIDEFKNSIDISLYESKKGLGNALTEGFKYCKNKWIYFVPADFSFGNSDIKYIDNKNLYNDFDLYIGSKGHFESNVFRTTSRKVYSYFFNKLIKIFLDLPYKDTQGTLIFKKELLSSVEKFYSEEFLITTEIILKAFKNSKKILEVPVKELNIETISTVKPLKDGFKMLLGIIKLKNKLK